MTPEVHKRYRVLWYYSIFVPAILFAVAAHAAVPFIGSICFTIYAVGLLVFNLRVESQIGGN